MASFPPLSEPEELAEPPVEQEQGPQVGGWVRVLAGELGLLLLVLWRGLRDALALGRLAAPLRQSRQLREALLNCCGLNAGLFLGSHLLWTHALLPCLLWLYPAHAALVRPAAQALYYTLWLGPLWALASALNANWYRQIAAKFAASPGAGGPQQAEGGARLLADRLYGAVLLAVLLALVASAPALPVLGPAAAFCASCWLYSYYALDYKWAAAPLAARTRLLERHWLYFLGYGAPMTALYCLVPSYLVGVALFACFFPVALIQGMHARPVRPRHHRGGLLLPLLPQRLPIFLLPSAISARLFSLLSSLVVSPTAQ